MQITKFLTLLIIGFAVRAHAIVPVNLVDLKPTKVEFGMTEDGYTTWGLANGPGVIDLGTWGGQQQMPWKDSLKIVKGIKPNYKLPEGQKYSSFTPDVVAVAGEFQSGVCLLAMSNCMYYWLDYKIPMAAKKFTAKLFTTDDVAGRRGYIAAGEGSPPNQDFIVRIKVDEKVAYEKHYNRMQVTMGSGQLIARIELDLPSSAKTIRFYLESTTFPDNLHNELVISGGKFE